MGVELGLQFQGKTISEECLRTVLRGICGHKEEEITGRQGKLHKEELHN
jgi:hypothetical protein